MLMNATRLAFALILIIGVSATEKKILKTDLPEDTRFWARELQDMSVPPTPTASPNETPVSVRPTPTVSPNETPLAKCDMEISITCTVGEGIECINYQVSSDKCLEEVVYTYTFENTGDDELEITEATSEQSGEDPSNLMELIDPKIVAADKSTDISETVTIDFCQKEPIITVVKSKANPGPCEAEKSYQATADVGRALRGRN